MEVWVSLGCVKLAKFGLGWVQLCGVSLGYVTLGAGLGTLIFVRVG
jgi:hypothetical protein